MKAEEVMARVVGAYEAAMARRNSWRSRTASVDDLFRGIKLFGRDAGIDFIETNFDRLVTEAVETAGCKAPYMDIATYGFGVAAVAAMEEALRDRTGLHVVRGPTHLRLSWGELSRFTP